MILERWVCQQSETLTDRLAFFYFCVIHLTLILICYPVIPINNADVSFLSDNCRC